MPEIKLSNDKSISKSLTSETGNTIQKASNTMSDIITLISKGEQLVGHIENIVGMFKPKEGAGSSIIQSKGPTPNVTIQEAPPVSSNTSNPGMNDKVMEAYFSSPEGLKKIAEAIDRLTPLIGDLKLSEVKQAILNNISTEKTKSKEKK